MKRACTSTKPCKPCVQRNYDCTYGRREARALSSSGDSNDLVRANAEPNLPSPFDLSVYESVFSTLDQGREAASSPWVETSSDQFSLIQQDLPHDSVIASWDVRWAIFGEFTLTASLSHRPTDLNLEILIKFPFLGNFTASTGFVRSFECGTSERRSSVALTWTTPNAITGLSSSLDDEYEPGLDWIDIAEAALEYATPASKVREEVDRLMPKTHLIVAQIRDTTVNKARRSIITSTWSPALEGMCYDFFHPTQLEKYLALFWSCWYPNWPTIHRPTFKSCLGTKSFKLLAAMAIVGACLSPDDRDRSLAQIWFNPVEELIFDDEIFLHQDLSAPWRKNGDKDSRDIQIEILQAAYSVCLYQTWEGGKHSRKRILRQRYSSLVFVSEIQTTLMYARHL